MQSIKSNEDCKPTPKPFPKLMYLSSGDTNTSSIALMISERVGTVVSIDPNCKHHKIGQHSDYWSPSFMTDYDGSICLAND